MPHTIRIAIADDHPGIIDGYRFRLVNVPDVEIAATARYGEEVVRILAEHQVDVLLLDVNLPTSPRNRSPYPILHLIPTLREGRSSLKIVVISMHATRALVRGVIEAGASGYVLKDDQETLENLAALIRMVAGGGYYFSREAFQHLGRDLMNTDDPLLTWRQREVLSLAAAYPELSISRLAEKLGIAYSTFRNLLYEAYHRLAVDNRTTAVIKARELGLIAPVERDVSIDELSGGVNGDEQDEA